MGHHRLCANPGGYWVHFSELDTAGFRKLDPGQEVDFEWQKPTGPVEGFAFVATKERPVQTD
ncbi:hypothetical protein [Rhodococcus sp. (in: high G+C Gram-positive bacteria)]|uniref:hypothetical protein n=1 Tax=Rhodococcus sp. TaxID=1831 RepID=UPI003BB0787E